MNPVGFEPTNLPFNLLLQEEVSFKLELIGKWHDDLSVISDNLASSSFFLLFVQHFYIFVSFW